MSVVIVVASVNLYFMQQLVKLYLYAKLTEFQRSNSTCYAVEVHSLCLFEINLVEVFKPVSKYGRAYHTTKQV